MQVPAQVVPLRHLALFVRVRNWESMNSEAKSCFYIGTKYWFQNGAGEEAGWWYGGFTHRHPDRNAGDNKGCFPGPEIRPVHVLPPSMLTVVLLGGYCQDPCFADEETEVAREGESLG